MASTVFTQFKYNVMRKVTDLGADTFKVILVTAAPTQSNLDNWTQYSDVTGIELASGSGYTTGGVAVANPTPAADTANHRGTWTADNAQWTSITFVGVVGAIVYDNTPATKYLLAYEDFGGSQSITSGTFTAKWNNGATSGIAVTLT